MPTLRELLPALPHARVPGDLDVQVAGIAYDSRLVQPGDLFVALPGFHVDGATFVPDAVRRGASAVVTQQPGVQVPEGMPCLLVPDARRALTDLAAAFYGYPALHLRVVGVTGTDGKTTTCHLVSAALEAMGYRTGLITTVDLKVGSRLWYNETQHTTPEPVEVQGLLRQMVDEGIDYCVVESSSHALALDRLLHCEFDAAVLTNLSPEHLDFHGSLETYRRDKARLFAMLDGAKTKGVEKAAILNTDDPSSPEIRAATRARTFWYGVHDDAGTRRRGDAGTALTPTLSQRERQLPPPPLREGRGEGQDPVLSTQHSALSTQDSFLAATNLRLLPGGSRFTLKAPTGSIEVESRLPGRFNVYNWLAAAAVGLSQGASLEQIRAAMAQVDSVPGRMQRIDAGQPFAVVVDFAHTPQALQTVMETLRPITSGRLLVLFGLAGERDAANRPAMGRLAARMADFALFTTDDPRFEDPMEIAEQIAAGARAEGWREGEHFLKIADRGEAIREAFRRARPGDTVLLAGKGHERRQMIRGQMIPWNDADAARRLLEAIGY